MKARIISHLFVRQGKNHTDLQVVKWWEVRRIVFNLLVGIAGVFTCVVSVIAGAIVESFGKEAIFPDPPLFAIFGVILYGVAANVCYTRGWLCELAVRRFFQTEATAFGRLAFALGLIGSIILTLLPSALVVLLSIIELASHPSTVQ